MGEKTTVDLSTQAIKHMAKVLNDTGDRFIERFTAALREQQQSAVPASTSEPEPLFAPSELEPWTRVDSSPQGHNVVAFLDDARALRWVDEAALGDVPKGWRPLLVAPAVRW